MTQPENEMPSPALLLYLYADRLMPKDKALTQGFEVPCRDTKVQMNPLAEHLLALSFWYLREQGLISLEIVRGKVLFVKTTKVVVRRTGTGTRPGLEGALLNHVGQDSGTKISDVIYRWYGSDSSNPHWDVVNAVTQEALAGGYLRTVDVDRGAVGGFLLGKTKLEPVCESIVPLEGAFNDVASRWQNFQTTEAELQKELLDACRDGIKSRRESDSDSGPD